MEPSSAGAGTSAAHPHLAEATTATSPGIAADRDSIVATVAGRPVPRERLVELLIASRGAEVLETLIGYEAVAAEAERQGITLTQSDLRRERRLLLRRLADPLYMLTPDRFDAASAERLLETVLAQRRMSREELDLITRRNAYLRKLVGANLVLTESDLRQEYRRLYGRRLRVRHIQLPTPGEAARVQERLRSGEDFADLARRYSANLASASEGGLLLPFSPEDPRIPALFREAASALSPGEVSPVVRIGSWYHLIRLVEVIPPDPRPFESVRRAVEESLRERRMEPAMKDRFEKLLRETTMTIHDKRLRKAYLQRRRRRNP